MSREKGLDERSPSGKSEGSPFRQSVPAIDLSIQRGTADVDDDGCYHVLLAGEEILKAKSKQRAVATYRTLRDSLATRPQLQVDVKQALLREVAEYEVHAFLAQSSREKRAQATRKGGKGGSGGVGG